MRIFFIIFAFSIFLFVIEILSDAEVTNASTSSESLIDIINQVLEKARLDVGQVEGSSHSEDPEINITSVNYISNGNRLNATVWLAVPLKEQPTRKTEVTYGVLLDSDFDGKTGYFGTDYSSELTWHNDTKHWDRITKKWSGTGQSIVISQQLERKPFESSKQSIKFSIDLQSVFAEDKYRLAFFAKSKGLNETTSVYTKSVAIPAPELSLS